MLDPDATYSGDNGRLFCGQHAGASAKYSGRDLSGQKVKRLTPRDLASLGSVLKGRPACETCRVRPPQKRGG